MDFNIDEEFEALGNTALEQAKAFKKGKTVPNITTPDTPEETPEKTAPDTIPVFSALEDSGEVKDEDVENDETEDLGDVDPLEDQPVDQPQDSDDVAKEDE